MERKALSFEYLPAPDFYDANMPTGYCALVVNDGSPLTDSFISKLKSKGTPVAVLNLSSISNPISENGFNLTDATEQGIQSVLERVRTAVGKIGSFIHLHPKFTFEPGNFAKHFSVERDILKTVFLIAKFIKEDLNVLGEKHYARFMTISQMDGLLGKGKSGNVSIVGGGLTGLVKCLNLEWSSVFCRSVDIDPSLNSARAADIVFEEYHDANRGIIEVGYKDTQRLQPIETLEEIADNTEIKASINEDSVFLVSGGAKGVTATCIKAMAEKFPCKFILLGRSDIGFEIPAYALGDHDERSLKALILSLIHI